jgi:sulfur relay protein TusB/DsrH
MKSILMLISSSPNTPESAQALDLAKGLLEQGNELGIFFLQDGVYHTLNPVDSPTLFPNERLSAYCMTEDLEMRGFRERDVVLPVKQSNYDELVDLMMERFSTTIGAY